MTDLATFLLARIAEDESAARAAILRTYGQTGRWVTFDDKEHLSTTTVFAWNRDERLGQACETEMSWIGRAARDHIARHDPARVLAECEAKRRIVDAAQRAAQSDRQSEHLRGIREADNYTLWCLSLPYADHTDYREEWRP